MNLNDTLIKEFVKAINTKSEKQTMLYYGTIDRVDIDDETKTKQAYVHLDGAEKDLLTPVVEGTEVMINDRVLVTIENHKAIIMSNITSPASARTANSYMDLVDETDSNDFVTATGLVVGQMKDIMSQLFQNVLIGNVYNAETESYENGVFIRLGSDVLAKFTANQIKLGTHDEIIIQAAADNTTVERFNSTTFTLSKNVSRILSVIGETCIETVTVDGVTTENVINDVVISSSNYTLNGNEMTISNPLDGTTIEPRNIVVTYMYSDKPKGTISIGTNSVISDSYPLVIGNNNAGKQVAGNVFSVDWSGKVKAAGGCNVKILYKDVTVNNLTVGKNASTWGTAHITVPSGYFPCALVAYRVSGHPCYFVKVDLHSNGDIEYSIHNPSDTNWTGVSIFFQISCVWTG